MTVVNKTPAFNLKVVVAETGIKPDTLRAWERRYGLPNPERTSGKHRLYSQYDLEIIKWLIARQEEGMSISKAVELWKRLEEEGQNPLLEYGNEPEEVTSITAVSGSRIEELRQAWITACHQFDETTAEQVLAQAFAIYPPETVCLQVLRQGLAAIGDQWYRGEATVQQEHFASALAMRRLHTLMAAVPVPTRRERIIVACPPQEDHAFVPLLLSLMLRYRGWHVVYLGADVPRERFETTLDTVRPNLVLLSAQQLHTAASMVDIAQFLQEKETTVAFGGLIFNLISDLHKRIPGHFIGARLEDTPHVVENLIKFVPQTPDVQPVTEAYEVALEQFKRQQSKIESYIWEEYQLENVPYPHFVNANLHMARNIISALTLGDMHYIGTELSWLEQLLSNYQWPPSVLPHYLEAYHEAAETYLNGRSRPVVEWLAEIVANNNK